MIVITPSAIRLAISMAIATATKVTTSAMDGLVGLFDRLKDACRRLVGLNATSSVSVSVSVSTARAIPLATPVPATVANDATDATDATDASSTTTNAFANANESDDEGECNLIFYMDDFYDLNDGVLYPNDYMYEDSDDEDPVWTPLKDANTVSTPPNDDDSVSITSLPWLPEKIQVFDFHRTNLYPPHVRTALCKSTMNTWRTYDPNPIPEYGFFEWIPKQVLRRLATDDVAKTYVAMIRNDDKYATLEADMKEAAILLLNVLHLLNRRFPFEHLDGEFAIIDIVARVLTQAQYFVDAYDKLVEEWHHHYIVHWLESYHEDEGNDEYPERVAKRTELTNAFPLHRNN